MKTNRIIRKIWHWTKNGAAFVSLLIGAANLIFVAWIISNIEHCVKTDCGPGAIGIGFVLLAFSVQGWIVPLIGTLVGFIGLMSKFKVPAALGLMLSIFGFVMYLLLALITVSLAI